MKGGRASKGAGDIYRSRTLQQTPTWTKNTQRMAMYDCEVWARAQRRSSEQKALASLSPKPLRIPSTSHRVGFPL